MAGSIHRKQELIIAGFREPVDPRTGGQGALWNKLYKHIQENSLDTSNVHQLGLIFKMGKESFDYMVGLVVPDIEVAKALGLDVAVIQESDYAILNAEGPVPYSIIAASDHLLNTFLPQSDYRPAGPIIEAYAPEGDPTADDYQMQVWIPVKKVED